MIPPRPQSIQFEVNLSFTAGMELWKLPGRYVIPRGYKGWVRVYYKEKGALPLPRNGKFYVLRIPASGVLHTSSELRSDIADAQFVFSDGRMISVSGASTIRVWREDPAASGCTGRPSQIFFVGTDQKYIHTPKAQDGGPPFVPCR